MLSLSPAALAFVGLVIAQRGSSGSGRGGGVANVVGVCVAEEVEVGVGSTWRMTPTFSEEVVGGGRSSKRDRRRGNTVGVGEHSSDERSEEEGEEDRGVVGAYKCARRCCCTC